MSFFFSFIDKEKAQNRIWRTGMAEMGLAYNMGPKLMTTEHGVEFNIKKKKRN